MGEKRSSNGNVDHHLILDDSGHIHDDVSNHYTAVPTSVAEPIVARRCSRAESSVDTMELGQAHRA